MLNETDHEEYICRKKAVRIRTVETHTPWPHIREKVLLFSNFTDYGLKFYTQKSLDEMGSTNITETVTFFSHINAEYGLVYLK